MKFATAICIRLCARCGVFLSLLGFAFLSGIPWAAAQDRGQKHALVIGVNRYENKRALNQPDLRFADSDAEALAKALRAGGFGDVVVMTTRGSPDDRLSPRAANIRKELKALVDRCGPDDRVVVAFAGYERQFRGSDEYYLCGTDALPSKRTSMVSLDEVYQELDRSKAALKLVLVDACRGAEKKNDDQAPQQKRPPEGVAALFACSAGEVAYEHEKLGGGLFTTSVIEGLRGAADQNRDGQVSVAELLQHVRKHVPEYARQHVNARQTPELIGRLRGQAPLASVAKGAN